MKTALIVASNSFYKHNEDEWDSFRSEGRIPINIGFGLSLLGYNVNIVCHSWTFDTPKKTWNNIQLSKAPLQNNYDLVIAFGLFNVGYITFNTGIIIVYDQQHITNAKNFTKSTGIPLIYGYQNKNLIHTLKTQINENVQYIPASYPIASVNIGFAQCSYKPELPTLKVFLIHSSWAQNTTISSERFSGKEQTIIDYLKVKGYKVKLSVLIENKKSTEQFTLSHDNITLFHSNECSYREIINLIQQSDICITNGAPVFPGNSLIDIISLGKPLIYIGDGRPDIEWVGPATSYLYSKPDKIIHIQDTYHESIQKIDRIMSNPCETAEQYQDVFKDYNFNNWKYIVKDLFDIDKEYL